MAEFLSLKLYVMIIYEYELRLWVIAMFNLIMVFANEILIALWYMITNERNLLLI